jgi:hypothetical protein
LKVREIPFIILFDIKEKSKPFQNARINAQGIAAQKTQNVCLEFFEA